MKKLCCYIAIGLGVCVVGLMLWKFMDILLPIIFVYDVLTSLSRKISPRRRRR